MKRTSYFIGEPVMCNTDKLKDMTKKKVYEVLAVTGELLLVENDMGLKKHYSRWNFDLYDTKR